LDAPASQPERPGALVEIRRTDSGYGLYRQGTPYFIKGIGGSQALSEAQAMGANSVRTWGAQNAAKVLDRAEEHGMSVLLGIWFSHRVEDYRDPAYRARKEDEIIELTDKYRNHPALLMWAVGNEVNLQGADRPEVWQFLDEMAQLIKRRDRRHPVISVIAFQPDTLTNIARFAPHLDAVGVNAYGALPDLRAAMDASAYTGPYLVTEWGEEGHWEADHTAWDRPIELSSAAKAARLYRYYVQDILAQRDRCLGSYVFLWGQKQERTPTWYSLFVENLPGFEGQRLASAAVDVMGYNWQGTWSANHAPNVAQITINGIGASDGVALACTESIEASVAARDPDSDALTYVWEILEEPTDLSIGGAQEIRPPTVGGVYRSTDPRLVLPAPDKPGAYRLFVYVMDDQGHVGTANIPFQAETIDFQADNAPTDAAPPASNTPIPQ